MFLIPTANEFPTLKTAENGDMIAPNIPVPTPLKNPLTPSCLALLYGFVNIPVIPVKISVNPPYLF